MTPYQPDSRGTELFLARQPIFDHQGTLQGYELLHRRDGVSGADVSVGEDRMSAEVLVNAFLSIGIARITGEALAHVNLSRQLLVDGLWRMLPQERVVVELPPSVRGDEAVVSAGIELVQAGYTLVLDDFRYRPDLEPLLAIAGFVKIDVLGRTPEDIRATVTQLASWPAHMLAMRVETAAMRDVCSSLGFRFFQGYFFGRPELVKHRELAASPPAISRLLELLSDDTTSDADVEEALRGSASLTVKLLRAVNSSAVAGRGIESIRQAVELLGRRELHRWLSLMLMASGARGNAVDDELMQIVMRRARMCEIVAIAAGDRRADTYFLMGLFSMLDAVMRAPMAELLREVNLPREVNEALLERTGPFAPVLLLIEAFEHEEWDQVQELCNGLGIGLPVVREAHADAIGWASARIRARKS